MLSGLSSCIHNFMYHAQISTPSNTNVWTFFMYMFTKANIFISIHIMSSTSDSVYNYLTFLPALIIYY